MAPKSVCLHLCCSLNWADKEFTSNSCHSFSQPSYHLPFRHLPPPYNFDTQNQNINARCKGPYHVFHMCYAMASSKVKQIIHVFQGLVLWHEHFWITGILWYTIIIFSSYQNFENKTLKFPTSFTLPCVNSISIIHLKTTWKYKQAFAPLQMSVNTLRYVAQIIIRQCILWR